MELNIRPVYLNGKRRFRWKYIGNDTKPKSITKNTYKDCKEKAEEKIKEVGFIKFDSQEVTLNEAYESFYKRLKYKIREGVIEVGHAKDYGSFYTNHILPYFNNVDIRKIGEQEINGFVQ